MRVENRVSIALVVLAVMGCGSGEATDPEDELAIGTMVATIDGVDWSTTTAIALNASGRLVATGNGTDNLSFGFGVDAQATGTYTVGGSGNGSGILADSNNTVWEAVPGGSGTITITSFSSNEVTGTFSFNLARTLGSGSPVNRVVTNGRFRVRF